MIQTMLIATTTCSLCHHTLTDEPGPHKKHLDHVIPINIGGTHTNGNVRVICQTCNLTRPRDGSDITNHQPTLWATDCQAAQAAAVLKPRRLRKPPRPKPVNHHARIRREVWTERARAAVIARRLLGLQWWDIANKLGYGSAGAVMNAITLRLHLDPKNL